MTTREIIGYIVLPNNQVDINYIKDGIVSDLVFDKIIDGCHSEYGDLTMNDNTSEQVLRRIMQCYLWSYRKYNTAMKLRFWLEKDKWDWRVACEVLT